MNSIHHLHWYEWIGWCTNVLMITVSIVFVVFSILGDEWRAALIVLSVSVILISVWTWILLYYCKTEKISTLQ
jgi:hypothetical protein